MRGSSEAQEEEEEEEEGQEAQIEGRRLMHVDWAALAIVAVVSIAASVIFTILLASGVRLVSAAKIKSNEGGPVRRPSRWAISR